jgi:hypothetical protein
LCKNEPLFARPSDAQQKVAILAIYPRELRWEQKDFAEFQLAQSELKALGK